MGKKEKKPDKAPPSDVFDPLAVETHQAATCVLMLESPEEDVLAKACEALYKFVEKNEDNKKTLLDLGVIDHLLRLVQHDDRIVRRNACMAFGLMSSHAEVRKLLKKRDETVPSMIKLLSPEEDTLCHEFAAMTISHMATDYASKVVIIENNGLESLVRGLSENDPDVQKNCVEAVGSLMQDYQARVSLKELEGIPPLLNLTRSEYPAVQELALVALQRATQDSECRTTFREVDGLTKLVEFIGTPEYSDLHVLAVMVLSNCLEDTESITMIKESGGLQKLVAYITDVAPPEDENDKKKGGKGGKDAKGGKGKDKDGKPKSAKSRDDKQKGGSKGVEEGEITPTLPDVKQFAAKALARAAKSVENKKILHECEIEKMLILLLANEDVKVQVAAAEALGVMAEFGLSRDCISRLEGMEPLVKILKKEDQHDLLESASLALANLTNGSQSNVNDVVSFGGIDSLVSLLSHSKDTVVSNVCVILANMSTDEEVRTEIEKAGIIQGFIKPLGSRNPDVQAKSAMASAAYLIDADSRTEFRNLNGLELLVKLLDSGNDAVRRNSSWALSVCAVDQQAAMVVATLGGIDILQKIQLSGSRKNAFTEAALDRLLNHNLSAKYAMTGFLGSNNIILDGFYDCGRISLSLPMKSLTSHLKDDLKLFEHIDTERVLRSMNNITSDGFYDAGAMKPGVKFAPLEALCKKELDQKRPVILINPAAERLSTPRTPELLQPGKDDVKSVGKAPSRSGRDSKSKYRSKDKDQERKEKEEEEQRQREAEEAAAAREAEKMFVPPPDPHLLKYIEDVTDKIMPLPNTRLQVNSLAEFVSYKMGGPIPKGEVTQFSWELPISQLKYERKSNVLPIGCIKAGIHIHRALLFKVLADRIGIGCTLERGEYNRAWNTVMLFDEDTNGNIKFPPKAYIVDLVHNPGYLMAADTVEAEQYKRL